MVKIRYAIPVLAAIVALLIAGCGGGGDGGSSSGGSELANLAPPGSLVFAEGQLQPKGELKQNVDSVAKSFTGGEGLGQFVMSELESSARQDGQSLDFAKEVEPWLGERGGVAFEHLVGGELSEPLIMIQSVNAAAARTFIDKRTNQGKQPSKDVSYAGVEFKVGGPEDNAVGLIGETVVLAQSEKEFKAAVDASKGESLGGEDRFQNAIANASSGSFADIYIDVGGLTMQSEDEINAPTKELLDSLGVDPSEATAVASVIPQSEQIEIDLSSELGGESGPSGDVSDLLGSLPARSFAAVGFSDPDEGLQRAVDSLDELGLPPELKPHELKSLVSEAGIDLDEIVGSIENAALFVEGRNSASLSGAIVIRCKNSEASEAVDSLALLLKEAAVPGVSAVEGLATGFAIKRSNLGPEPIIVLGEGKKVLISYGFAAIQGVVRDGVGSHAAPLSGDPSYKAAVAALGKTPISGFVDGPAALQLAEALIPRSKSEFWDAVPNLKKISYIGIGNEEDSEVPTAKLIAGVRK